MFDPLEHIDLGHREEDHEEAFRLTVAELAEDAPGDRHCLPQDLEQISPGLFLAAIVASVDRSKLTGHDVVRLMTARARLVSHGNAGYFADVCEVAHAYDPDGTGRDPHPVEFAAEEFQTALHKTRRAAEQELTLALDLRQRVPGVWAALNEGHIDLARARVFATELESLHPALVPEAVARVIDDAPELTTGQLRARLQRISLELDPEAADDRHRAGLEDRRMVLDANPDHTASLLFHNVGTRDALGATRYVNALAHTLKRRPGETRTMDQLRADIALDLLQGKALGGSGPVPAPIMLILTGASGHVPGFGTVLPESVAELLEDSELTVTNCTHETSSRRPTKTQARHISTRYPTCIFPGCRMPSTECDLDHRIPWSERGSTTCENLAPLCRHHHVCKTRSRWRLERDIIDDSHLWTSPLGFTYRTGRPP
jgi:hypothetical protein